VRCSFLQPDRCLAPYLWLDAYWKWLFTLVWAARDVAVDAGVGIRVLLAGQINGIADGEVGVRGVSERQGWYAVRM
jgi:hypothetical protein